MGLFGGDSSTTTQQFDQRQANDASGAGAIIGTGNRVDTRTATRTQISITDGASTVTPIVRELLMQSTKASTESTREALRLADSAIKSRTGEQTAKLGLVLVAAVLAVFLFRK
jgi:hypothetical protein